MTNTYEHFVPKFATITETFGFALDSFTEIYVPPMYSGMGKSLGLIDFNCKYDPQLSDIGKIRNKWLMGSDKRHGRPLTPLEIANVLMGYHSDTSSY